MTDIQSQIISELDLLGFIDRTEDDQIHKNHPEVLALMDRLKANLKRFNTAFGKRYTVKTLTDPIRVTRELLKAVQHQTIQGLQKTVVGDKRLWTYSIAPLSPVSKFSKSKHLENLGFYDDLNTRPVYSDADSEKISRWNGLYLRSIAEKVIAEELENQDLQFLVNAGGRFRLNKRRVTRELDFIVFIGRGRSAILEVDGWSYHQSAAKDHTRDRIFRKLGMQVERFDAQRCINTPHKVVSEFLEIVK